MLLGTVALAAPGATAPGWRKPPPPPAPGCGKPPPPPDLDDLMTQLDMARSDSRLASDAATAANPEMRPALAAVSSERAKHAEALSDEIARLTGEPTTSSPTTTTTSVGQATTPTAKDVIAALRT